MTPSFLRFTVAFGALMYLASCEEITLKNGQELQIEVVDRFGNKMAINTNLEEGEEEESEEGGGDEEVDVLKEEIEEDALVRLRSVHTLGGFLSLLYKENGDRVTPDDIFSKYESEDGTRVLHKGGRLAVPDKCSPRNTTVYLQLNGNNDSREIFFPRCTKVPRCGGCCSTPHLKCLPVVTETDTLMVVKARASRPGSPHLVYNGIAPVRVDRHVTCRVRCTLSPAKCGRKKTFLANQCVCKCRRYRRCMPPQVFNPDTCGCECPGGPRDCCRGREPQCGYVFNRRECSCDELDTGKVSDIRTGRVPISNKFQNTTPALNTATTTTDPNDQWLSQVKSSPCAGVMCPRSFRHVIVDGKCFCRPTGCFGRRRFRLGGRGRMRGRSGSMGYNC